MRCEKIQDLLLTEYLDKRLIGSVKEQVEDHLRTCVVCQKFWARAKVTLQEPFTTRTSEKIPTGVRQAILERLSQETAVKGNRLFDALSELRMKLCPVAIGRRWMAAMAVCLLTISIALGFFGSHQARQQQRIMFLAEIADWSTTQGSKDFNYGTTVEQFFL